METHWSEYSKHTCTHTHTHTLSNTVLAVADLTDGKTAESREEMEIKVTVSGRTIRARGLILHSDGLNCYHCNNIMSFLVYLLGVFIILVDAPVWTRLKYLNN